MTILDLPQKFPSKKVERRKKGTYCVKCLGGLDNSRIKTQWGVFCSTSCAILVSGDRRVLQELTILSSLVRPMAELEHVPVSVVLALLDQRKASLRRSLNLATGTQEDSQ